MRRIAFHIAARPDGQISLSGGGESGYTVLHFVSAGGLFFGLPLPPDLATELAGVFSSVDIDISIEIPEEGD